MLRMNQVKDGLIAIFVLIVSVAASNVWAHGGVAISIDTCRIPVGDQWVHFTGYTPQQSSDTEYCRDIPYVGHTNLVFDYEGRVLTKLTVEFTITKEPEGTEVYYQEPKVHQTGTVNAVIDFSKPGLGEGSYLAHVTLVNEGEKIDAHLPINISKAGASAIDGTMIALIAVMIVVVGVYLYTTRQETAQA